MSGGVVWVARGRKTPDLPQPGEPQDGVVAETLPAILACLVSRYCHYLRVTVMCNPPSEKYFHYFLEFRVQTPILNDYIYESVFFSTILLLPPLSTLASRDTRPDGLIDRSDPWPANR